MIRRIIALAVLAVSALVLAACGTSGVPAATGAPAPAATQKPGPAAEEGTEASNILVAYFSWSGNTAEMAAYIAGCTGGDLLEIQPETPYPEDYGECGDVALAERDSGARPAIANLPENLDGYDTLFIGYPIWNADLPMPLYTFLEIYDFGGAVIVPFTVHGGSGLAGTPATIQQLQPDAQVVTDALSISRSSVTTAPEAVSAWLDRLGI